MRYTLTVRADRKDQVQAIISKLPSRYEVANVDGAEVIVPVGQLATLVPVAHEEGTEPTHYILDGEFNEWQLRQLKAAVKATRLMKGVTWWDSDKPDIVDGVISA